MFKYHVLVLEIHHESSSSADPAVGAFLVLHLVLLVPFRFPTCLTRPARCEHERDDGAVISALGVPVGFFACEVPFILGLLRVFLRAILGLGVVVRDVYMC